MHLSRPVHARWEGLLCVGCSAGQMGPFACSYCAAVHAVFASSKQQKHAASAASISLISWPMSAVEQPNRLADRGPSSAAVSRAVRRSERQFVAVPSSPTTNIYAWIYAREACRRRARNSTAASPLQRQMPSRLRALHRARRAAAAVASRLIFGGDGEGDTARRLRARRESTPAVIHRATTKATATATPLATTSGPPTIVTMPNKKGVANRGSVEISTGTELSLSYLPTL